ncbi:MAG: acylneuraminate cytidylyltransferase family protein [Cohaesibacteraceae bacterium]|nr:acylneuraminate cytidylyltransferase family protein [Cohaesibacteraceae bacterium]MBL4875233.1 acylneuraminate cytidylyltransferase family protein [Cohaesibacteraceae bacterium]
MNAPPVKILAVITARGGSKELPHKNIYPLDNKPLIAWTIDAALNARLVTRVIVSTDDQEIATISKTYGADIPFIRPLHLATDEASSLDVLVHAARQCPGYDYVVLLQPTSPLRTSLDIDQTIELCTRHGAHSSTSVCETEKPPNKMYYLDAYGDMNKIINDDGVQKRRQELPHCFALNGATYVIQTKRLLDGQELVTQNTKAFIMPKSRSIDIDDLFDIRLTETIIKHGFADQI